MLRLAVAFLLFASVPSFAANELAGVPLSKIQESGKKHGLIVEKLNAADTAAIDAVSKERPKPSTIYLLTLGESVILVLVRDGQIIYSTDPVDLKKVNDVLKRGGA